MISVSEALERVVAHCRATESEILPLDALYHRVLAVDLRSPVDLPPFAQSSMDGYAVPSGEFLQSYRIAGETRAGQAPGPVLLAGEARRVFTGAALPPGTAFVVKQEEAKVEGGIVHFSGSQRPEGQFVREKGSAVRRNEPILPAGTRLGPGALSLLASCGIAQAAVHRLPRVSILLSGDELRQPGEDLDPGQIYESNSYALAAAVVGEGLPAPAIHRLQDNEAEITRTLEQAVAASDVVLLSGGISVGDYDFSGKALQRIGAREIVYRVAQKPGMPFYFGTAGEARIFALPGNPASALVCYWLYVLPALRAMMGLGFAGLIRREADLLHDLHKTAPRAAFERALLKGNSVQSLEGQESYQLRSLAEANALLELPAGECHYKSGDPVQVLILPGGTSTSR